MEIPLVNGNMYYLRPISWLHFDPHPNGNKSLWCFGMVLVLQPGETPGLLSIDLLIKQVAFFYPKQQIRDPPWRD